MPLDWVLPLLCDLYCLLICNLHWSGFISIKPATREGFYRMRWSISPSHAPVLLVSNFRRLLTLRLTVCGGKSFRLLVSQTVWDWVVVVTNVELVFFIVLILTSTADLKNTLHKFSKSANGSGIRWVKVPQCHYLPISLPEGILTSCSLVDQVVNL